MTHRKLAVLTSVLLLILLVAGCIKQSHTEKEEVAKPKDLSSENYTIALTGFSDHPALNACREGFLAELQEANLVVDENLNVSDQNAGSEIERAKLIATSYISMEPDLIYCVGSTSTGVMLSAMHHLDVPIVFAAVTDPVSLELCDADGVQQQEITGVSDPVQPEEQLRLIQQLLPKAKRIGIIYSREEVNSIATIESYRSIAAEYGMGLVLKSVQAMNEVAPAFDELIGQVDCLLNIQDNLVTTQLSGMILKAMEVDIPVFGCDEYQAQEGCLAALGTDYQAMGKEAAKMAIRVLSGESKASQIPFAHAISDNLYLNLETAKQLGIEIPDKLLEEAEETYETIGEQGEE